MILHINASKEWRGGENQVLNLAIGLKKAKVPQIIMAQPNSPLAEKARNAGIEVVEFLMRSEFDWKAIKKIRELVDTHKVHIVHTHTSHAHSLAFFAKKKKDNWKLIVARRVDFRINKSRFSLWKFQSNLIDMVVGVSRYIQRNLISDGMNPTKTLTIHSGIDISKFKKLSSKETLRKELDLDKKTLVIGIVAALVDHKDYPTFIQSIAKIKTNQPFVALVLGEGSLKNKLLSQVEDLGIQDRIQFLGFREDVNDFYGLFDIFCLSSKEEGLGTSILDAMAAGLPIVATKAGGIPEMVIHEKGGYLSEVGDSESLAQNFSFLLENASLRKKMGSFNQDRVEKFSYETTVKKTIQLYYSYLGDKLFLTKASKKKRNVQKN
ncbi:MAG: glycosyltransferase [Leptospira sp.]|nr:glycosyltransferase [Leptospira sp.]